VESSSHRLPVGFRIIGIFKLATAVLSLALGFGLLRLFRADVREGLEPLVRGLRLDPENRFIHRLILGLARIDRKRLELIEAGTFVYAILHLVEGIGILRGKRWGGWLIIAATSSLVPLECYELARRPKLTRLLILIFNMAIVAYLIRSRDQLSGGSWRSRAARRSADNPAES
jgi:uncharacterized membrane protein (DUF2068 family)